jgi:hypothetical protein
MGRVREQDKDSGLVERSWVRLSKRHGKLTEHTLEGQPVEAAFLDGEGHPRHVTGPVRRDDAGVLVVESWADCIRRQTPVTRDANVTVISRKPSQ